MSLEQQLCIRVILRNGTVKEIDPDLKLDPINYCLLNNTNTKYEIKKNNNIIVYLNDKNNNTITYVNATDSSDSSDPTSYMEWGAVIDWDGKTRSLVPFPGFWINSTIQPNANNKFGFIRFNFDVMFGSLCQYSSDDSGNLTVMSKTIGYVLDQPLTIMSTLNNGYLAFFNVDDNNSLLPRELYVRIISYNDSKVIQGTYVYQIPQPNMIINSVCCDSTLFYIDCIVSVNSNNTTRYILIHLSQSGLPSFLGGEIDNLPNVTGLSHKGWRAKTMPFGGYILGLTVL
ncbi:hypothetical protein C2G38_2150866 [Gigaspora rosea]|uniref:Uncharacterized protein n=1 Tax=Gigaspora rosea TaxID=44941 RepID=A0A397TQP6_9GLOM|nr:hypothetical protein C2G38_2150866 [Gigaspora rosea]